jgi:chemotaxis protein CheX
MGQVSQNLALDELLAQEISTAVVRAMKETFGVDVIPGDHEIGDGVVSLVGDVSGIIGMVQDHLEGTLTLSLTFESVRDMLPQIVGNTVLITHEMTVDAVGEITNMIFGQIKSDLNKRGYRLKLGIPSVVTGRGHFVSQFHRGRYMVIPFHVDGQLFQVHIALHVAT